MTSIITHEIEERYPYPDNGERPVTQTRLGACLASRKAYRAGATRNPTDREIDMAALAIYTGTSGMSVEEVLPLWPDMNPDAKVQYRRLARLAITAARTEARHTGDVKRLCLTVKTGGRIDAITCQVLDDMTGALS